MSVKKKQILIIGGVLLILVATLLVLLLTGGNDEPTDTDSDTDMHEEEGIILIEKEVKDLSSVEVTTSFGTYLIEQTSEDTDKDGKPVYNYSIKEYEGLPVDTSSLNGTAKTSTEIFANSIIEENSQRLKEFGLETPASVVKQTYFDGSVISFKIGNETPSGEQYYVCMNDETTVYEVAETYIAGLLNDKTAYLDCVILPSVATYPTIDELTVTRSDWKRPVKIVPQSDNDWAMYKSSDESVTSSFSEYKMISPVETSLDIADQSGVMYSAWGLSAASAVKANPTADEIKACGLDNPYCTFEMIIDGEKTRIIFGSQVGNVEDNFGDTFRYGMLEGRNIIYSFNEGSVYWLSFSPEDVITRMTTSPYIYNVSGMKITYGGNEYNFAITPNAEKLDDSVFTYNGTQIDGSSFRQFYMYLHKSMIQTICYDANVSSPEMVIEYSFVNPDIKPLTLEFYKSETRSVYVGENGEVKFTTTAAYYERLIDNLNRLTTGESLILAW